MTPWLCRASKNPPRSVRRIAVLSVSSVRGNLSVLSLHPTAKMTVVFFPVQALPSTRAGPMREGRTHE